MGGDILPLSVLERLCITDFVREIVCQKIGHLPGTKGSVGPYK